MRSLALTRALTREIQYHVYNPELSDVSGCTTAEENSVPQILVQIGKGAIKAFQQRNIKSMEPPGARISVGIEETERVNPYLSAVPASVPGNHMASIN